MSVAGEVPLFRLILLRSIWHGSKDIPDQMLPERSIKWVLEYPWDARIPSGFFRAGGIRIFPRWAWVEWWRWAPDRERRVHQIESGPHKLQEVGGTTTDRLQHGSLNETSDDLYQTGSISSLIGRMFKHWSYVFVSDALIWSLLMAKNDEESQLNGDEPELKKYVRKWDRDARWWLSGEGWPTYPVSYSSFSFSLPRRRAATQQKQSICSFLGS